MSVSQSVSLSHETSWTLYRSQSSTDLHQTCHQGRVPGDVVTYCFWWKPERRMSTKQEIDLIFTIGLIEKIDLMENISKLQLLLASQRAVGFFEMTDWVL